MSRDPAMLSLLETAQALRRGKLRAIELVERCIDNHCEPLNAYKSWQPDTARGHAELADQAFARARDDGPLQGIPVSVKDLYGLDGVATFAGTPQPLPEKWCREGPLIKTLRTQHAVFTGKTHTVEFAFGGLGVNSHWGTPKNPWDNEIHRVPGGSSSGAGVSLGEGSALLALGSDTAGSVRIPASMTGNVGLKTSYGRWPLAGIFPLSPSLDTAGILTRSVADAVYAFAALDPHQREFGPRLLKQTANCGVADFVIGTGESALWSDCESSIAAVVEQALKELATAGVRVVAGPLPEAVGAIELLRAGSVVSTELDELLSSELPQWRETLDPLVSSRIRDGGSISASEYLQRQRRLRQLSQHATTRFDQCQVIASPTVPISPPALADVLEIENYRPNNLASLRNTCPGNTLGLCAITLPVGLDSAGLPVGMQLLARHGHEEQLLAISACIERVLGPPISRLGRLPNSAGN